MFNIFLRFHAFILLLFACQLVVGQVDKPGNKKDKLEIINAELFVAGEVNGQQVRKLIGEVILRQDSTYMYCDSAYQNTDKNQVEAFSRVKIIMSDSMWINSDYLLYEGDPKIAHLRDNISMYHGKSKLTTDYLDWFRNEKRGDYYEGGKLEDGENTLTSVEGQYYSEQQLAFFKEDVKLVNDDFTLTTDSMAYDRETETAMFRAPTDIEDKDGNFIYTERGFYDTKGNLAFLYQNPYIRDTSYTLSADTIYYDRDLKFGQGKKDLQIVQSDSSITVYGQYGEFEKLGKTTFVTGEAYAIQIMDGDTLYLFGDTLYTLRDSIPIVGDSLGRLREYRTLKAFYNVHFFMNDLQGRNDSLVYLLEDSIIKLYQAPILWSEESQLTGDSIKIWMANKQVDSMVVGQNGFIISKEDTLGFDQVKGHWIRTKFKDNQIRKMWVDGNSESLYWIKEDKQDTTGATVENYVGMNKAKCTDMYIQFKDNKPQIIKFFDTPEGEFLPVYEVIFKDNYLEGFTWRIAERPEKPEFVPGTWELIPDTIPVDTVDSLTLPMDTLTMAIDTLDSLLDSTVVAEPDSLKKGKKRAQKNKIGQGDTAKDKKVCFLVRWWRKLFPKKENRVKKPKKDKTKAKPKDTESDPKEGKKGI